MTEFAALAQLTVVAMVPYLLASLGTMLGGLAGVFSVSQEGIMILGASVGFLVSYSTGSNTVGILVAAMATLAVQKVVWHRVPRVAPRVQRVGHARV